MFQATLLWVLSALAATALSAVQVEITAKSPQGIQFSIADQGYSMVGLHYSINKPVAGVAAGDSNVDIRTKTGNNFVYEDNSVTLKPGDKVNYWVLTISSTTGEGVQLLDQSFTYSESMISLELTPQLTVSVSLGAPHTTKLIGSTTHHKTHWEHHTPRNSLGAPHTTKLIGSTTHHKKLTGRTTHHKTHWEHHTTKLIRAPHTSSLEHHTTKLIGSTTPQNSLGAPHHKLIGSTTHHKTHWEHYTPQNSLGAPHTTKLIGSTTHHETHWEHHTPRNSFGAPHTTKLIWSTTHH
ncbi:hypothetical protein Btru_001432 [Bulinus truncatus]|nr:hypothetical protein Btru_001432 [Bulinus truncatus]